MIFTVKMLLIALPLLISSASCARQFFPPEGEELFTVDIGTMKRNLAFFSRPDGSLLHSGDFVIDSDGSFFISDPLSGKILHLSAYNELLNVIYNPDTNLWNSNASANEQPWHFQDIGHIAISSEYLVVEDADERGDRGERLLLFFDKRGNYRFFLGSGGRGSMGFVDFIEDIHINDSDELTVITRRDRETEVYMFSSEGELIHNLIIDSAMIPVENEMLGNYNNLQTELIGIMPGRSGRILYLIADFTDESYNSDTGAVEKISFVSRRVFTIELNEGNTIQPLISSNGRTPVAVSEFDHLLGCVLQNRLVFRSAGGEVEELLFISADGRALRREVNFPDSIHTETAVDGSGLVIGFFYQEREAKMIWWRSDRLFAAVD